MATWSLAITVRRQRQHSARLTHTHDSLMHIHKDVRHLNALQCHKLCCLIEKIIHTSSIDGTLSQRRLELKHQW